MKRITLPVVGMTCEYCVRAVTQALQGLEGVRRVVVSLKTNTAEVEYDEHTATLEAMKEAVEEGGYRLGSM